jgi:hypothetical protein
MGKKRVTRPEVPLPPTPRTMGQRQMAEHVLWALALADQELAGMETQAKEGVWFYKGKPTTELTAHREALDRLRVWYQALLEKKEGG